MIEIIDLAYLRVGATDLDEAASFATETIGLQEVRREENRIYVRGDERDHDICYVSGGVEEHVVGFEVSDQNELEFVRFSSWFFLPGLMALLAALVWWFRR